MKFIRLNSIFLCALGLIQPSSTLLAATTNVVFGDFFFNPKDVTIQVGDTVVWSNLGGNHTVTGTGADPICGLGSVPVTCSNTFTAAGEFPYICAVGIHAALGMTGIVRVAQAAITPAVLSAPTLTAEGDFEFTVATTANRTNVVEVTTNAANPGGWTPIATLTPATDTVRFTDTNTSGFQIKLYRVIQPE